MAVSLVESRENQQLLSQKLQALEQKGPVVQKPQSEVSEGLEAPRKVTTVTVFKG
jgi:DNA-binding HxlR family transcriptional regulator